MTTDSRLATNARATDTASTPDRPAATDKAAVLHTGLWAVAACFLTLVNRFIGIWVPLDKFPVVGQHVVASLYFAALLYTLMCMTRAAARIRASAVTLLITGLALATPMGSMLFLQSRNMMPPEWLILTANNLFLPIGAALVGTVVGRIIKHPNTLLAAAGFSLFFDIVVVTMGTVAALSQTGSQIISMVSVGAGTAIPHHTSKTWSIITGVTIGPADILFLSVFFASVFLLQLESRATFRWIYTLLLAALVQVEWIGLPVPALAPMGIAVILANYRHAAFTDREKRDLMIGGVFAIACAGFIVWNAQRYAAKARAQALIEQRKHLGFQIAYVPASKAYVVLTVLPESRAEKAGLRPGDVVQKINGTPVETLAKDGKKYGETLSGGARNGITLTIKSGDQPKPRDMVFPPGGTGQPDPTPLPSPTHATP